MATKSYQPELPLKDYLLDDTSMPYTSIVFGIFACKTFYDLAQLSSSVYFKRYSSLTRIQRIEWNNRVMSTFHAVYITIVSLYYVFCSDLFSDQNLAGPIVFQRSVFSSFAMGVSIGYFISDLAMILWFYPSLGGMEYVVHHLLAMISLSYAIVTGEGQLYTYMILLSEATTPSINLRWYLDTAGMKKCKAYVINGVIIFLAWLVARILLFVYLLSHVYAHLDQVKQMKTLGLILASVVPVILSAMNLMWFSKITKGLVKTLAKRH